VHVFPSRLYSRSWRFLYSPAFRSPLGLIGWPCLGFLYSPPPAVSLASVRAYPLRLEAAGLPEFFKANSKILEAFGFIALALSSRWFRFHHLLASPGLKATKRALRGRLGHPYSHLQFLKVVSPAVAIPPLIVQGVRFLLFFAGRRQPGHPRPAFFGCWLIG
jgi:hypothetical protein